MALRAIGRSCWNVVREVSFRNQHASGNSLRAIVAIGARGADQAVQSCIKHHGVEGHEILVAIRADIRCWNMRYKRIFLALGLHTIMALHACFCSHRSGIVSESSDPSRE